MDLELMELLDNSDLDESELYYDNDYYRDLETIKKEVEHGNYY